MLLVALFPISWSSMSSTLSKLDTEGSSSSNLLTLNRPGFFESSTAGGGGRIPPPRVISLFEDQ